MSRRFMHQPMTTQSKLQPALLERYWELWARHPQGNDPLLLPLRSRRRFLEADDIPF